MTTRSRMSNGGGRSSSFTVGTEDGDTILMGDQSTTLLDGHTQYDLEEPQQIPVDNIRVEAPSDLPGGYQMETEVGGRPILVTVPKGGVQAGEFFTPASASLLSDIHLSQRGATSASKAYIPVGGWRDRLFWDYCTFGPCHITVWQACCCPLLAAGQLITRLQLTWYGTPAANVAQVALAFQTIVMILVGYWCLRIFIFLVLAYIDPNADPNLRFYIDPPPTYFFFAALDDLIFYVYFAFTVIILRNIRSHMRARFNIPERDRVCCPREVGCEDVCCSLCCPCFTAAQMMRHTADYEAYNAACCTNTGLNKDAPGIV